MTQFEIVLILKAAILGVLCYILRRRTPRLASVCLGISLLLVLVAAAEMAIGVLDIVDSPIDVTYPDHYYSTDAGGVVEPLPGAHRVVAKRVRDGSVYYDVTYTVDDFGRRVVPGGGGPYSSYSIFVGDSFTYGDGVEDAETLPAAYARLHPDVHVYNYGFHGAGPYDVLARLETGDFAREVAETTGTVVYTFIDEHVLRTRDFIYGAAYRGKRIVYEPDAEGRLVRCGTWTTCRPWRHRLMRMLSESRIVEMLHLELPPALTKSDFDRLAGAACRMDEVVRERLPGGELRVLFYPGCRVTPKLLPLLDACGVRCTDASAAFDGLAPPNVLSLQDRHPTPEAYARVAELLPR
jgi:hypothetical protein